MKELEKDIQRASMGARDALALCTFFASNANAGTKRGIALKGIEGEQNPTAKRMFATGNFAKLYLTYGLIFASGAALTALSIYAGDV